MSEQPDTIQANDDLGALEQVANVPPDLTIHTDVIEQGLNFIFHNGGDHLDAVLDDIQYSTNALVNQAQDVLDKLQAAVAMAKTLRGQREAARRKLAELQEAIADHDTTHPELNNLVDSLTESITWEIEEQIWDMIWEHTIDRITDESPLDYTQANRLLAILTEGEVEHDASVWARLTAWINDVDREIGYIE